MKVKLSRDETRAVQQYFFPFMQMYCETKLNEIATFDERMMQYLIVDIFNSIKALFAKRLNSSRNSFSFKLTDANCVVLYRLLMNIPVEKQNAWLIDLRQWICNEIYLEFNKKKRAL